MKTIEDNFLAIFKAMMSKGDWVYVTDEQKKKWFFIHLRYMSKKYPEQAQFLNDKLMDEVLGMNLIYAFLSTKTYPKWFWSKTEKKAEKSLFIQKDLVSLQLKLDITSAEMEILTSYHSDEIKEELKYLKSLNEDK